MEGYISFGISLPVLPPPQVEPPPPPPLPLVLPIQQKVSPQWTTEQSQMAISPVGAMTPQPTAPTRPEAAAVLLRAPPSTEWEAHKDTINDLYMDKNLNLNEVVERMKAHDFHATPRMYKAQFARWGWSKYNCKRMRIDLSSGKAVVKSQGKSCYRVKRSRAANTDKDKRLGVAKVAESPDSSTPTTSSPTSPTPPVVSTTTEVVRRPSLHQQHQHPHPHPHQQHPQPGMIRHIAHTNDTTRFMQSVLSDIRSHVCEVFSRKPDWHQSRRSKIALINAYNYTSYDKFVVAMDAFLKNEHTNGGEILRQAFLEVEEAIQTDYSSTFYFIFIDLPDLFLHYSRHDILTILLGHIKRLTAGAVRLRDKMISGNGFAALHALAETDPAYLRHYISTASGLWCDLLSELRGPRDRSTLLAKRNYLRHDRNVDSEDHRHRVGKLCDDYVVLLAEVHQQFGHGHDMSSHMEDVCLSAQMIHDFFVEGFVVQNERLVQNVESKYRLSRPPPRPPGTGSTTTTADMAGNMTMTTLPLEAWDVLDHNIRSNCYHRLSYFYHFQGDTQRSEHYRRKASEGWRGNYWHLEAEEALVAAGRHFEAESLRRCRLEAQYFRKLPENDKLLSGRGELPSISTQISGERE